MSRPQDSIIDDDEESCPLCIEEFDLTDKNFKPCPCGYQICQFCFNSLKNTYEKSTCPNCRRVYDEKTIQFKIPSKEDIVNDKENKARKQAATKRKETEKREVETSNRRNLAGVRVKQQNLVYVIGLVPSVKDEGTLLQTLRGPQYFGQYGEIDKIVVSKSKPGATSQGIGVYITYATKEAAALCIEVVDGSMNGDRVLRAQYGTTKYCSAYLRGENCNNKSCTFLHETGEEGHGSTLQNEPSHPKAVTRLTYSSQAPHTPSTARPNQLATHPGPASSQNIRQENGKDETKYRANSIDTSALPSTASWATKDSSVPAARNRRSSQTGSRSSASPQVPSVAPITMKAEGTVRQESAASAQVPESSSLPTLSGPRSSSSGKQCSRPSSSGRASPKPASLEGSLFDKLIMNVNSPSFRFSFNEKAFTSEELAAIERCPTMIDPYGGAKRRLMREKEAERLRQQLEAQAKSQGRPTSTTATVEEENIESGSLALGGEPEEGTRNFSGGSAIQRPNQPSIAKNLNSLSDHFSNLGMKSRNLTTQQRQHLALLSSANVQQAPGLGQPNQQSFGLGNFDEQRQNSFLSQQYDPGHGHARQSSRYSFANDSVKPNPAPRFPTQQHSGPTPQHFYPSGVQGPPPGLKTAGTPPISGGGMFAQGHGFTSNMNAGFSAAKDSNTEMLIRGRSGTGSGPDISKRGGVVDLADPGILQARLYQTTGGAGQGLFGGQHQEDRDFPPLAPPTELRETYQTPRSRIESLLGSFDSSVGSSTPRVPPGLNLPHAHPSPSSAENAETKMREMKAISNVPRPVTPALPMLPIGHRPACLRAKVKEKVMGPKPRKDAKNVFFPKPGLDSDTAEKELNAPADTKTKTTAALTESSQMQPSRGREVQEGGLDTASVPKPNVSTDFNETTPSNATGASPPTRLDISAALAREVKYEASAKPNSPVLPLNLIATPIPFESLPSTPNGSTAKSPDWASAGRARTLRLTTATATSTTTTTTPKSEAAPASAVTERSSALSAAVLMQASRHPSLSSISRSHPSTPTVSEHGTSTGISRAGSPPASDVGGSGHQRNMMKTQSRKLRKAKSRTANGDEECVVSTPPISEEVGPIISRQKKKKKTQENSSQASGKAGSGVAAESEPTSEATPTTTAPPEKAVVAVSRKSTRQAGSDASRDHPVNDLDTANARTGTSKADAERKNTPIASYEKKEQATGGATKQKTYTLNDLFNDVENLPDSENAFSELLNASVSATSKLLRQLVESNEVDLNSALFNVPPLTSYKLPPQSQKGADYLDVNGYTMTSPFGEIYLSGQDRKQLLQGRDVRLSDPSKPQNVLKRNMITRTGAIFRHLSAEEEDRVIELENRMRENEARYGITGKRDLKPLDDMDFLNLTGGLQELMAFPPLHRISLLTAEPGTEEAQDDDVDFGANGSDETEDEMAPLASGFGAAPEGPMRKPVTPNTMRRKAEALMAVNLRNLDVDKLQKRIRETQVEMEGARKEMEALEKKAARKAKDVARWREALSKDLRRGL